MTVLEILLPLRRRQCEERRHHRAELELLAQCLRADAERLRAEIERSVAVGNPASAWPLIERHSKLERSVAALDGQIAMASDALSAAEQELRRHELAAAQCADRMGLSERRRASDGRPRRGN